MYTILGQGGRRTYIYFWITARGDEAETIADIVGETQGFQQEARADEHAGASYSDG